MRNEFTIIVNCSSKQSLRWTIVIIGNEDEHQLAIVLTLYLSYYKAKSLGGGRIPWRASDLLHQFKQYLATLVLVMSPTAVFIPVVLPVLTVPVSGSKKKETV